jgi:hypothetical protein
MSELDAPNWKGSAALGWGFATFMMALQTADIAYAGLAPWRWVPGLALTVAFLSQCVHALLPSPKEPRP